MISKHVVKTSDYYAWIISSVAVLEQNLKVIIDNPDPENFSMQELVKAKAYLARLKDEYFRVEYLMIYQITDIEIPLEFAYLFYKTTVTKAKSNLYVH